MTGGKPEPALSSTPHTQWTCRGFMPLHLLSYPTRCIRGTLCKARLFGLYSHETGGMVLKLQTL